jgi:hypothetical protein
MLESPFLVVESDRTLQRMMHLPDEPENYYSEISIL